MLLRRVWPCHMIRCPGSGPCFRPGYSPGWATGLTVSPGRPNGGIPRSAARVVEFRVGEHQLRVAVGNPPSRKGHGHDAPGDHGVDRGGPPEPFRRAERREPDAAPPRPSGAGWRAVTWRHRGQSLRSFPQRYSFRRQPRGPGIRPGPPPPPPAGPGRVPDHAPRRVHRQAAVGCADDARRSRPRRNDGGRATRRQAFFRPPCGPSPRPSFRPRQPEAPARGATRCQPDTGIRIRPRPMIRGPASGLRRIVRCPFARS